MQYARMLLYGGLHTSMRAASMTLRAEPIATLAEVFSISRTASSFRRFRSTANSRAAFCRMIRSSRSSSLLLARALALASAACVYSI